MRNGMTCPARAASKATPRQMVAASARALALLVLTTTSVTAQAPGDPISTTVLEPAGTQTGQGRPGDLTTPTPDAPEDGFPAVISAGEGPAVDRGDKVQTPLAPETAGSTSEPVEPHTPHATAPDRTDRAEEPSAKTATVTGETAGQAMQDTADESAPSSAATVSPVDRHESPPARSPSTPSTTSAQVMLTGLWRAAVTAGETTLGFEAWLEETLGSVAPAAAHRPEIPADQAGRTRMVSERWLARAGPVALGAAGRVVTTFGSAIPTLFCAPLLVCYVELEPGEVLTNTPSWGDTVRWQVRVKTQGRDPATVVLEVKPADDAKITNLVIPTDRRLYTINLINDPEVHTPILSFLYPDSAARQIAEEIAAREAREAEAKAAADRKKEVAAAARAAEMRRAGV